MPWKLIGFIVFFGILLAFIGLNLNNSCDISFGFTTIPAVPIYLTVFSAFVLGLLCTVPLIVSLMFKKPKSRDDARGVQKRKSGKKTNKPEDAPSAEDGSPDVFGGGPYGTN
jgi:uncharacterized integral membrane protein